MFWSKNKKNIYPCKPQFYYIKVGCKGVFVTRTCYQDGNGLNGKLENVQKRAARFMTRNYSLETGSMTGIFEE